MDQVGFYAFSFNNPTRKQNLLTQFQNEDLPLVFTEPVLDSDPRLKDAPQTHKRNWAIMWNHLDMLRDFLNSSNTYGIFVEDDLILRKGFRTFLPELIASFNRRNLEILLLAYLTPQKPACVDILENYVSHGINLLYLQYDDNIWGAHMYMLNRQSAQKFLDIYTEGYAKTTLLKPELPSFSPDWTLTKIGNRALVYPMMGLEEGTVNTSDQVHIDFHKNCHDIHYNSYFFY